LLAFQQIGHPPGPRYLWPRLQVFHPPRLARIMWSPSVDAAYRCSPGCGTGYPAMGINAKYRISLNRCHCHLADYRHDQLAQADRPFLCPMVLRRNHCRHHNRPEPEGPRRGGVTSPTEF